MPSCMVASGISDCGGMIVPLAPRTACATLAWDDRLAGLGAKDLRVTVSHGCLKPAGDRCLYGRGIGEGAVDGCVPPAVASIVPAFVPPTTTYRPLRFPGT
jgi:hypothetical protein